jgi:RNA-directed DNA polymerase
LTKGNAFQTATIRTQGREVVTTGLERVRERARKDRDVRFTSLLHHVTFELLMESYYALKRQAAPGVDGETWRDYEEGMSERLRDLHERVHRGSYRAKPSRRTYIPKADGRMRPLGIAALEDKIVQQAVATVLNVIYEESFVGFSYGFRPGRNQHQALDALSVGIKRRKVSWVLDADIRSFFDTIDHGWMMKFIEHRIGDPRIIRLIRKWLRAGVVDQGKWTKSKMGVPQGGVISPLLANIYLHYVFDLWTDRWRRKSAKGDIIVVRYADDFVVGFQHRHEAMQFLKEMHERMEAFGLALHPEKTRLIEFGRHAKSNREGKGKSKPETFNFLGFTHICDRARKDGRFFIRRITERKRLRAKLEEVKAELKRRLHQPMATIGRWLRSVVQGYFNYYAVPGNIYAMGSFRAQIKQIWLRALRRRSQKHRMTWERFAKIVDTWLPKPKIVHLYPEERFYATNLR